MTEFELFKQANELTQKGEWLAALKIYEKIVKKDPIDAYLWHRIGEMNEELENHKGAIICFEKARSLGYDENND
jgi:tetratricopeptide (TPR) repeat protein